VFVIVIKKPQYRGQGSDVGCSAIRKKERGKLERKAVCFVLSFTVTNGEIYT
jgi:hypothetical protein